MKYSFAGFITGLLVLISIQSHATPIQWTLTDGGNDHWYELFDAADTSWTDANTMASALSYNGLSGHLGTITSAAENSFIFEELGISNRPIWLGGFQDENVAEAVAEWQWVTGENWTYSNWAPGEPNNSTWNDEDSLAFAFWKADGSWNDAPTGYNSYGNGGFVVEYETAPVPEPATMLLFGIGLVALAQQNLRKRSKA